MRWCRGSSVVTARDGLNLSPDARAKYACPGYHVVGGVYITLLVLFPLRMRAGAPGGAQPWASVPRKSRCAWRLDTHRSSEG